MGLMYINVTVVTDSGNSVPRKSVCTKYCYIRSLCGNSLHPCII